MTDEFKLYRVCCYPLLSTMFIFQVSLVGFSMMRKLAFILKIGIIIFPLEYLV